MEPSPIYVPVTSVPDKTKPVWQSKTAIAAAITALVPLVYPPAAVWIAVNPELFSAALGALFGILRYVSNKRVVIK